MKILNVIFPKPLTPLKDDAMLWRILNVNKMLKDLGHEVDLFYYAPRYLCKYMINDGYYNDINCRTTYFPNVQYLKDIYSNNYDCILSNTIWSGFNSLLGKFNKTPYVVMDVHGLETEELMMNRDKMSPYDIFTLLSIKTASYFSFRFVQKIICVSKKMKSYLNKKESIPLERIYYITNGVDLDFFRSRPNDKLQELRGHLGLENKFVFGYIGGFQKYQGVENFIDAASDCEKEQVGFLFVGANKKSKTKNILFVPEVPRPLVPAYYSICDVLVLPRPYHIATELAAPTKFSEYAAIGKPILTTNVGDAADFVREYKCGIVAENNSKESLIRGINDFIDKPQIELEKMGQKSRELAEKEFDWKLIKNNLENIFNK